MNEGLHQMCSLLGHVLVTHAVTGFEAKQAGTRKAPVLANLGEFCCAYMRVELAHAFVGCNRVTHALDWGPAGLVIYAAHNAVVVYDPKVGRSAGSYPATRF